MKRFYNLGRLEYFTILLIILAAFCYLTFNLSGLEFFLANKGWSITNLTNSFLYPSAYTQNNYNPQLVNLASISFHIFFGLAYLGIPIHWLDYINVFLNFLFYCITPIIIFRLFDKKPTLSIYFTAILFTIASSIRLSDLGNWGIGVIGQSPYAISYLLSAIGIVALFKEKIPLSLSAFSLSILCHPILGFIGAFFGFCTYLPRIKTFFTKRNLTLLFTCILLIAAWEFYSLPSLSTQTVPTDTWISFGKIFNYHWFPVAHGFLWSRNSEKLIPLLAFLLLLLNYLKKIDWDDKLKIRFLYGVLGLLLLTGLGLLFSISHSQTLIKLALQRSDSILLIVGIPFISIGLWQDLTSKNILLRILAGIICLSAFVTVGGIPAWPTLLLILIGGQLFKYENKLITIALYITTGLLIGLSLLFYFKASAPIFSSPSYLGINALDEIFHWKNSNLTFHFSNDILTSCTFLLIILLTLIRKSLYARTLYLAILTLYAIHFSWQHSIISIDKASKVAYKNYFELQEWARNNTPEEALFMIPPNHSYGWSDFSKRQSLGTLHDWLQISWMYTSNKQVYKHNMALFSKFNVPLAPYLSYETIQGFDKLRRAVKKAYYTKTPEWFLTMANTYNISYFILNKSDYQKLNPNRSNNYPCRVTYQNSDFIICKPKPVMSSSLNQRSNS